MSIWISIQIQSMKTYEKVNAINCYCKHIANLHCTHKHISTHQNESILVFGDSDVRFPFMWIFYVYVVSGIVIVISWSDF